MVEVLTAVLKYLAEYVDFMKGGKSKGEYKDLDENALAEGTQHELEHTDNERIARKIASDHLKEHPDYYKRLKEAGL